MINAVIDAVLAVFIALVAAKMFIDMSVTTGSAIFILGAITMLFVGGAAIAKVLS